MKIGRDFKEYTRLLLVAIDCYNTVGFFALGYDDALNFDTRYLIHILTCIEGTWTHLGSFNCLESK